LLIRYFEFDLRFPPVDPPPVDPPPVEPPPPMVGGLGLLVGNCTPVFPSEEKNN
jgi:hypothetical protein